MEKVTMDTPVAVLYGGLWNDQSSSAVCLSLQTVCTWHLTGAQPEPRLSLAEREAVDEGRSGAVVVNRLWAVDCGHAQKDLGTTPGSVGEAGPGRKQ